MQMHEMRMYIANHPRYKNSFSWRAKCQTMSERQVAAIYERFKNLDYKKIEREMKQTNKSNEQYHQINMFEYMEGLK